MWSIILILLIQLPELHLFNIRVSFDLPDKSTTVVRDHYTL